MRVFGTKKWSITPIQKWMWENARKSSSFPKKHWHTTDIDSILFTHVKLSSCARKNYAIVEIHLKCNCWEKNADRRGVTKIKRKRLKEIQSCRIASRYYETRLKETNDPLSDITEKRSSFWFKKKVEMTMVRFNLTIFLRWETEGNYMTNKRKMLIQRALLL